MIFSLLPMNALAATSDPATDSGAANPDMVFEKKAESNDDGTYTITMTAQAKGKETTTTKAAPMDIVLVLDQSGSMAYDFSGNSTHNDDDRRQTAMKTAVNSFIDKVAEKYSKESDHRMAIVTFGSNAEVTKGWTEVNATGKSDLEDKINNLPDPEGATNVGAGMEKAQTLMNNAETGENRQKVVIVFTDGVPTTKRDFDTDVANTAISTAKSMKDSGVTVYTVGIFNGADYDQLHGDKWSYALLEDVMCDGTEGSCWGGSWLAELFGSNDFDSIDVPAGNRFLNYLSSNSENASEIGITKGTYHPGHTGIAGGTGWRIDRNADCENNGYYKTATTASTLEGIFTEIYETTIGVANESLNGDTVITDTLSEYFTFATDDAVKSVTVYAVDADGNKKDSEDAAKAKPVVSDKTVTVSGYDFSKHYEDSGDPEKLVIEITVKPDPTATWGPTDEYKTNEGNATVTLGSETIAEAESPKVEVTTYRVTYAYDKSAPSEAKEPTDPKFYISGQEATVLQPENTSVDDGDEIYTFAGWKNGDKAVGEKIEVTGDITLTGTWTTASNIANYTVEHYRQSIDGDYPDKLKETDNLSGRVGAEITATPKEYDGFTCDKNVAGTVESGTIVAGKDGLVLKLYYTRNSYPVDYQFESSTKGLTLPQEVTEQLVKPEPTQNVPYEAATTNELFSTEYKYQNIVVEDADGKAIGHWEFEKWTPANGTKMPIGGLTYVGYWKYVAAAKDFDLDVSRSKTATNLDSNYRSTVTLSLPSAEEKLASDIVFVLDGSSSADTGVVKESLYLLEKLKEAASGSGAAVNVCVVKFKRQAFKSEWFDLSKDFDAIKTAMEAKYSGGTNIHAGLLAGKEALEQHPNVSADRKYLILISDGSTYLYSKDGDWASDKPFTRTYYTTENFNKAATGGYWDNGLYEPNNQPGNVPRPQDTSDVAAWQAYLKDVEARNAESHGNDYDYHCDYDLNFVQGKPSEDFKTQPSKPRTANNRDMAFYYADQVWQQIKSAGYNVYSIATQDGLAGAGNSNDSHCFMNYLNGGAILKFSDIRADILYAVGKGSTVVDKMGGEFDFVPGSLKLTVGGKKLDAKTVGNVTYFGDDAKTLSESNYRFKVEYDSDEDMFTWTINENVSNFAPVQLSYQVQLVHPKTVPGTYKVPTNEYAKLTPVDSLGNQGKELTFPVPEVSYTVRRHSTPGVTKPALNTADHYAYVMGYPDGTVQPGGYITRAEASTIFFRLLTDETREQYWATTNAYSDIKSGDWYNNAISTLSNAGIVSGYPDGTFRPNAPITRAEMSKIIALFAKLDKTTDRFSDIAGHWAEAYIKLAAGNGWIEGYPDGTFKPQQNITRAETVTMINRVLERVPSEEDHLLSECVMMTFPDCKSGDWFYIAVQEATNSHTYERAVTEKNGDEQWTALRANRDWTLLEK